MSTTPPALDMASILRDRSNRVIVCCGAGMRATISPNDTYTPGDVAPVGTTYLPRMKKGYDGTEYVDHVDEIEGPATMTFYAYAAL